jgi:MoaA/NifB/PqqE/SkfB family radical SAM enzyme
MRSWRYFLEVNSGCNLKCPTCTKGNQGTGYEHQTGIMDWDLMQRCLDKIQTENPEATILLYGNSEPFLHPKLPECIAAVKERGFRCEMSSNLNYVHRLDEALAAGPDFFIISLSGFTQEVYVKGHQGGSIEKVKVNMRLVGEANKAHNVLIRVNYHLYNDNEHELPLMENYAAECGLGFFVSKARAISMENAIQYCREKDPDSKPYAVQHDRVNWNHLLPPATQQWRDTMDRLFIPPDQAREMYADYPRHGVCPVGAGSMFSFIRHDGKIQLCACTADRRITLGNYLEMTPEQMIEERTGHSICQQCMKYRLNLYFHIVDADKWEPSFGVDLQPGKA